MIIPSIDIMNGQAVQLVGGRHKVLDAGDPVAVAERFRLAGEIAVVDLDAALGRGSNRKIIEKLVRMAPCRVGGGIRDVQSALEWLDRGATRVVLGTAAVPEVIERLPADRVIAAVDAENGEVVVDGWRRRTGRGVLERIEELKGLVGGFLLTFVEREGRMQGYDVGRAEELVAAAGSCRVTVAGGILTPAEVGDLDRMGADAQVGMALYAGRLGLADAIAAPLAAGLWPTVVVDECGVALGLAYSSLESLRVAIEERRGVYWSRKRALWRKGETSGATQELLRVDLDCDRDTLRFTVRQAGPGFCHRGTRTCWGEERGLTRLRRRLAGPATEGSYTARLLRDPALLHAKLVEEAAELAEARGISAVVAEAADLFYFATVAMVRAGVPLSDVSAELDRRMLRLTRRGGDAK